MRWLTLLFMVPTCPEQVAFTERVAFAYTYGVPRVQMVTQTHSLWEFSRTLEIYEGPWTLWTARRSAEKRCV